jgi:hypothetical protein
MLFKTVAIATAALLAIGLWGCSSPSLLEKNWGRSFEAARTAQILNPDGVDNSAPVEGLHGPVVERILDDHFLRKADKKE